MTPRPPPPLLALAAAGLLATACHGPPAEADAVTAIGAVQGSGGRSPLEGREVTVEGVVTGNFARHLGGWFLQDPGDDDPATSDALFVLSDGHAPVRRGDRLRVRGRVLEHGPREASLTALQPIELQMLGDGADVAPLVLAGPPGDWEPLEGMRVWIDAPLAVSGHHELARRGVLVASFGGRLAAPTETALPGAEARSAAADNARHSVLVDDALESEHPTRIWYLPAHAQAPRTGSVLSGVDAVVDQRAGDYRLQLLEAPVLRTAPRPPPPEVPGDVRIAVLNLENLFNGDGRGNGFPTARGARSVEELARQLDRLQATAQMLAPDILAVMELENDGYGPDSSIAMLARALGPEWRFVDAGHGPSDDAIRVALLYRAPAVRTLGPPATLEGGPFGRGSRVPLAQAFRAGDGPAFTVVANHFKSKACGEAVGLNRDQDDGQGCWSALRTDSARRLAAWLDTGPTGTPAGMTAIVGDLNAYAMEDPLRLLREAGWQDAFGDRQDVYTYVYQGQAGRLDHMLLGPALAARLRGAEIWHANADEPPALGYRGDLDGALAALPWRSSDHDPILAGFDLRGP